MILQAQNAKEALERAGLQWKKDFHVHTERIMRGSIFVGYGNAKIHILPSAERKAVELTPRMLEQGLSVDHLIYNAMTLVFVEDDGKGTFTSRDLTERMKAWKES